MAKIITYSLRADEHASDCYYHAIADIYDVWMPDAIEAVVDIVAGFRAFRLDLGHADRSDAEYAFELLVLGVILREHGGEASSWPVIATWLSRQLSHVQGRWPRLDTALKDARGLIGWLARRGKSSVRHSGQDIDHLLAWMRANGQAARADRLAEWQAWFEPANSASSQQAISRAVALADDFDRTSRHALRKFTQGVELFRAEAMPRYQRRYDSELISRTPLEYHLGMFGTEVLNRAQRARYLASERRVVIVPPCMRSQPDDHCQAIATPLGALCQGCTPGCHIYQVTQLGKKRGFEVYMIPDELHRIAAEATRTTGGLGLVGVSCALTNWSGGWDADKLGIPAQGVLLDYVGCKYHWDKDGLATDANLREIDALATARAAPPVDEVLERVEVV